MVSVLIPRVVDREFYRRSGHTNNHEIDIRASTPNQTSLRSKDKVYVTRNQYNSMKRHVYL